MSYCTLRAFCFSAFFSYSLSAQIFESNKIKDILDYVDSTKKTLVIYDIDNTIAEPDNDSSWGSDEWVYAHVHRLEKMGIETMDAWKIVLPFYREIQSSPQFALRPIEADTLEVIKMTQEKADKVMVLTARSHPLIYRTLDLLEQMGLDFLSSSFTEEFVFDAVPGRYIKGVFFCGHGDKGESLIELLKRIDYWPEVIIFADDKYKNLHAVEHAVQAFDIEFYGIHYTRLVQKVQDFQLLPEVLD